MAQRGLRQYQYNVSICHKSMYGETTFLFILQIVLKITNYRFKFDQIDLFFFKAPHTKTKQTQQSICEDLKHTFQIHTSETK